MAHSESITFEQVFQPYLHLRLAAFENLKIVVGVLAALEKHYSAFEIELNPQLFISQVEDKSSSSAEGKSPLNLKPYYIVETEFGNIVCGRTNGYEEAIKLIATDADPIDLSSGKSVNVPILSLQQISFMCVETSHFDHC